MRLQWRSCIASDATARFEATWESLQQYNCPQWFRLGSGTLGASVFYVNLRGAK